MSNKTKIQEVKNDPIWISQYLCGFTYEQIMKKNGITEHVLRTALKRGNVKRDCSPKPVHEPSDLQLQIPQTLLDILPNIRFISRKNQKVLVEMHGKGSVGRDLKARWVNLGGGSYHESDWGNKTLQLTKSPPDVKICT